MATIREAQPSDAPAIAAVHVESWRSAYAGLLPDSVLVRMSIETHTAQWARTLGRRRNRDTVLVADIPGLGIAGFGSCGPARERRLPHRGEIYTLYVDPGHQYQGIGRQLLNGLLDSLVARGVDSALAWVLAENPSRFFYESMGGRRVAERDEALWNMVLHEAAYGWTDLAGLRTESDLRRER